MPRPRQETMDAVYKLVEAAAINGDRAPQMAPFGPLTAGMNAALLYMARAGRLRVEIFIHNWRVITLCDGPYKGAHTARSPYKGSGTPHKVIQKGDRTWANRSKPSAPRLLMPSEDLK